MTTLEEIAEQLDRLAKVIDAPRHLLPTTRPVFEEGVTTRVEVPGDGTFVWAIAHRGRVDERRVTGELDELLYWSFGEAVSWLASSWELPHRVPAVDVRAARFARELYLLGRLDAGWPARRRVQLASILQRFPYSREDWPKNLMAVQAYHATHGTEFGPKETGTPERIERRLSADERPDMQDLNVLRRMAVYVGLIARGVEKDESREVASCVLDTREESGEQ